MDSVSGIDTSKPHPARIYDYALGGKNHFAADREVADQALASWPSARVAARENRAFLGRAVKYLVAEAGVRQFRTCGIRNPSCRRLRPAKSWTSPSQSG